MNVLYISGNYENIQPKLLNALNNVPDIKAYIFSYDLRKTGRNIEMPEYGYYYALRNHIHGPFPYILRLSIIANRVWDYYGKLNIDVTHANMGFRDGFISYFLWKKRKIPYVISIRNTDLNANFIWKTPYIKYMCYEILKNAKSIICLSDSYKNELQRKLPETIGRNIESKLCIIPNGIDEFYLLNSPREKSVGNTRNIIFVGKIDYNKNLIKVIEAVELLQRKNVNIVLHVVGEIIDTEYKNIINNKNFIIYHGKQTKEELIKLYRASDILVIPSHTETFGLVYAEAMSQGLPVIYTKGQGFDSFGRHGVVGFAVSDTKEEEIADRIIEIYENYEFLSSNCLEKSKEFNWDNIANKLFDFYKLSIRK